MVLLEALVRSPHRVLLLSVCALAPWVVSYTAAREKQAQAGVLHIGSSGTLTVVSGNEKEAHQSLQNFIKDETGFDNEITRQKDWRELADKTAKRELQLGVFRGYEFAWAQQKYPQLKPLALAENSYIYLVIYVVVKGDNPAKDFAGLQGQSLALPNTAQTELRLFVERQCQTKGKKPEEFFAKITSPENVEDAIDSVVDGTVQAAVADKTAVEAYRRRKPGRFKQLKQVARSEPLPPIVVAYYNKVLDEATLSRFQQGLLNASNSDRGQTLLTLFRLTGFVAVPEDFEKVLEETRKTYPPNDH